MRFHTIGWCAAIGSVAVIVIMASGCGQTASDGDATGGPSQVAQASRDDHEGHDGEGTDDHSGWWCAEHGVPEEECSLCSAKAAAKFKQAGDWCQEHNRAASQCFICDPSQAEKFAKLYEVKFGHLPRKQAQ